MRKQELAAAREELADVRAFFGLVAGAQFADIVPAKALRRVARLLEGAELPADLDAAKVLQVLEKLAMRSDQGLPPTLDDAYTTHVVRSVAEALLAKYPDLKVEGEA